MSLRHVLLALVLGGLALGPARAQVPVVGNPDHESMLASKDPALAANKRLVYDFWREVFEAGQMDLAAKYMAEDYVQHNPMVPTGRQAFIDFFSRVKKPAPVAAKVNAPLVAIMADGDLVMLAFAREYPDPKDPSAKYSTTWFDMFRIKDGKIVEHWDPALKRP